MKVVIKYKKQQFLHPMKNLVKYIEDFSAVAQPIYYGTPKPLVNNCFEQNRIDPYKISAEGGMLCFSSSRQEAKERYAIPPIIEPGASFDDVMIAYKSEWFSKTSAIACQIDNVPPGGNPSKETLERIRREVSQEAIPTVYEVMVLITKPFVVDRNIPVHSERMSQKQKDEISKHFGDQCIKISLDKYEQPLRFCLMTLPEKRLSMGEAVEKTNNFLSDLLKSGAQEMNTHAIYNKIKLFFDNNGMRAKHSELFKSIHDGIILNQPGLDFANADYGDNKHVMIFDVDRVYFCDFKMSNKNIKLAHGIEQSSVEKNWC